MFDYAGSTSIWDVLPTITGQYFSTRAAEASQPAAASTPAPAPVSQPSADALTVQLAQLARFLPLLLLVGVGLIAYRALK